MSGTCQQPFSGMVIKGSKQAANMRCCCNLYACVLWVIVHVRRQVFKAWTKHTSISFPHGVQERHPMHLDVGMHQEGGCFGSYSSMSRHRYNIPNLCHAPYHTALLLHAQADWVYSRLQFLLRAFSLCLSPHPSVNVVSCIATCSHHAALAPATLSKCLLPHRAVHHCIVSTVSASSATPPCLHLLCFVST